MPEYPLVTFRTDFFKPLPGEVEQSVNEFFGLALSNWLVEKLGERGIAADVICAEDWGWYTKIFTIHQKPLLFSLSLGVSGEIEEARRADPGLIEWTIAIHAEIPFLKRLFKRIDPTAEIKELERHLRELVATIPNVSDIQWEKNRP
jgi:hypothetical protein